MLISAAQAFVDTLDTVPQSAITACRGWSVHELIAHLASGADALAAQAEAHLVGDPVPEFGAWQVREPPYCAMDDAALRRRLVVAERRMSEGLAEMLAADPAAAVADVGWGLPVTELITHMRQEFAIHRWDLIGDDDLGVELLGAPSLTEHSAALLGESLLGGMAADPAPGEPLSVRLRCAGTSDLLIQIAEGVGRLSWADPCDAPDVIDTDPAARLLLLWGRRPSKASRVLSSLSPQRLARLQTVLTGY